MADVFEVVDAGYGFGWSATETDTWDYNGTPGTALNHDSLVEPPSTPISGDAGDDQSLLTDLAFLGGSTYSPPTSLPISNSSLYAWKNVFSEPSSTPISGDAGDEQPIWESLAFYSGSTKSPPTPLPISNTDLFAWQFPNLEFVLDLNALLLFDLIVEESIVDEKTIPGREGGLVSYYGSPMDTLHFLLRTGRNQIDDIRAISSFKIRFKRYGLTWWEGKARTQALLNVSPKPGTPAEVLDLHWILKGHQEAVSAPNFGLVTGHIPKQVITLRYWEHSFGWQDALRIPYGPAINYGAGEDQEPTGLITIVESGFAWGFVLGGGSFPIVTPPEPPPEPPPTPPIPPTDTAAFQEDAFQNDAFQVT